MFFGSCFGMWFLGFGWTFVVCLICEFGFWGGLDRTCVFGGWIVVCVQFGLVFWFWFGLGLDFLVLLSGVPVWC